MAEHLIGLLLGTENDWPRTFEALLERAGLNISFGGETHSFVTRRMKVEPFSLRSVPDHRLVVDRVAWWYTMPREWLKKAAMLNDVYLLNDPFTFQSMEKHTAYCAMIRCGLNIPETWMLPHKVGPDNERYPETARRYNQLFDIEAIAEQLKFPLFMKPFDGGGWVGVTRVNSPAELHQAYNASGQRVMHVQAAINDYEWFARSLAIGPQVRVMNYRPDRPMHDRYDTQLGFLEDDMSREVETICLLVNSFFRWEFNSCEIIVKDGVAYPIDYANACPDVAVTSLHAHYPWALTALVKWCIFCCVTGRSMRTDMNKREYFAIGDNDMSYAEKLDAYRAMADSFFDTKKFREFEAEHLGVIDDVAADYFAGEQFDQMLVDTVRQTFQPHEQEYFIDHFRGLVRGGVPV